MKKLVFSLVVVAAVIIVATTVGFVNNGLRVSPLSDLMLANIEALARNEYGGEGNCDTKDECVYSSDTVIIFETSCISGSLVSCDEGCVIYQGSGYTWYKIYDDVTNRPCSN